MPLVQFENQFKQASVYILVIATDLSRSRAIAQHLGHPGWDISCSYSAREGIRKVASGRYDLVFCDCRLSDIPSTSTLQVIKNKFPWVRVILFDDKLDQEYISEVQALGVDHFFTLGATSEDLREVVARLSKHSQGRGDGDDKDDDPLARVDLLQELRSLPPVPRVVIKLWEMLETEDVRIHTLVSVVRTDPGLSAMLLRVANSVRYGSRIGIRSIERAISIIGITELRSLSIVHSTRQIFQGSKSRAALFDHERHWLHSVRVALTAERLASSTRTIRDDFAFSAGLLHDLGILVLTEIYGDRYDQVIREMRTTEQPRHVIEKRLFGFDHSAAGGLISRHWNLPEYLFPPIRFHHDPSGAVSSGKLTAVVYLANALVNHLDSEQEGSSTFDEKNLFALERLHLPPGELESFAAGLSVFLRTSTAAFGDLFAKSSAAN